MPSRKDSENLRRAAFHEAGHVLIRHHHGLPTPSVLIRPDGTGMTIAGGGLIEELNIRLDVSLAGYAAERLFDTETLQPLVEKFVTALRRFIDRGAPAAWDDYVDCVEMCAVDHPEWTDAAILAAMLESDARVTGVLKRRWTGVARLASDLLAAPGHRLAHPEILAAIA